MVPKVPCLTVIQKLCYWLCDLSGEIFLTEARFHKYMGWKTKGIVIPFWNKSCWCIYGHMHELLVSLKLMEMGTLTLWPNIFPNGWASKYKKARELNCPPEAKEFLLHLFMQSIEPFTCMKDFLPSWNVKPPDASLLDSQPIHTNCKTCTSISVYIFQQDMHYDLIHLGLQIFRNMITSAYFCSKYDILFYLSGLVCVFGGRGFLSVPHSQIKCVLKIYGEYSRSNCEMEKNIHPGNMK